MKQRTIILLLILLVCFPHGSLAQDGDDQWTCDDGPNDVLNAAQTAYDAGDLDRAYDLAQTAAQVCLAAHESKRSQQAISLSQQIQRDLHPEWPQLVVINNTNRDLCGMTITQTQGGLVHIIWAATDEPIPAGDWRAWRVQPTTTLAYGVTPIACDTDTGSSEWDVWPSFIVSEPKAVAAIPELTIINRSNQAICQVLVSPSFGSYVGMQAEFTNLLTSAEAILMGERQHFPLAPGVYSLRVLSCSGQLIAQGSEVDVTRSETAVIGANVGDEVQQLLQLRGQAQALVDSLRYDEALPIYEQALSIAQEIGFYVGEATILNDMGEAYFMLAQYNHALEYLLLALDLWRDVADRASEGSALNSIGMVYDVQGQYAVALDYYTQALAIVREVGDRAGEGTTLNNIGAVYNAQGQYAAALDHYTQALDIMREVDDRAGEGTTLNNIGMVYRVQGQYTAALDYYTQALDIAREVGGRVSQGTILNNIGMVYHALGQYAAALDLYAQALDITREVYNRAGEGATLNNIGMVYDDWGQYAVALDYYTQALEIAREVGNRAGEGTTLNNIGGVYHAQGQYAVALDYYTQTLAILREVGDRAGEGITLHNIGLVYAAQGQDAAALDHYTQALAIQREMGDHAGEGATLNNIGEVYHAQGQYAAALDQYTQALVILREVGDRAGEGTILNNIGLVYAVQGQYAAALDYYTQALIIERELGDRAGEITTLANRANVFGRLVQIGEAISDYVAAVELIEGLVSDAALDEAITALLAQTQHSLPYQRLAVLLTQQGDLEGALDYAERGRAVLARTDLSTDAIDFRAGVEADLLTTEIELRLALDSAQSYLDNLRRDTSATQDDVATAQSALDAARRSYDQHLSVMQLRGGYLSREIARGVASLNEIQAALSPDTTLLLYTLGNPNSSVFIVTVSGLDAVVLDAGQEQIGEVIAPFVADHQANAGALRDLYDLIFAPIADRITTSRLIIVPDGALNYVPFAALQALDGSYLIDDYSISMVSSGTTFVLLNDRAQQTQVEPSSPALVLAQPSAPGLPTLRNAPLEALEVADLFGVEPSLNATEGILRADVPGSAVLYITAHTELDHFAPLFSVIHLRERGSDDGRLEVREIYELDLSQGTELVVLSGCETASGGDGEDFGLLTRAFFAAGAPRVVASLWRVDDAATADLMTAFITERANYDNDADALRAAMLVTREQYPEPYYWASFVLSGLP